VMCVTIKTRFNEVEFLVKMCLFENKFVEMKTYVFKP
jgi:hypothetical protein